MIVRGDLPPGAQIAQAIHAAGESAPTRVPENTVAVALAARNQEHLLALHDQLVERQIPHTLIRECDGEPMAIGVEPTRDRKTMRKLFSSLPLAGRYPCKTCTTHVLTINRLQKELGEAKKPVDFRPSPPKLSWWRRMLALGGETS